MSPSPEPDPDLNGLREIFRAAAENSTSPGREKFVNLSKAFNELQDAADSASRVRFDKARQAMSAAWEDLSEFAKTDPATARELIQLAETIKAWDQQPEKEPAHPARKQKGKHWQI